MQNDKQKTLQTWWDLNKTLLHKHNKYMCVCVFVKLNLKAQCFCAVLNASFVGSSRVETTDSFDLYYLIKGCLTIFIYFSQMPRAFKTGSQSVNSRITSLIHCVFIHWLSILVIQNASPGSYCGYRHCAQSVLKQQNASSVCPWIAASKWTHLSWKWWANSNVFCQISGLLLLLMVCCYGSD